jgi:DNA polymerase-3 subunit epsilon
VASGYAVVHVETTGLLSTGHDRVIEVSVVHVDTSGRITGEWDTLVNPGRDLHERDGRRIRASDVRLAPTFAQVAPELCALLEGRAVVAHNARFVARFLAIEFALSGLDTPAPLTGLLCTIHLARRHLPGAGRSLSHGVGDRRGGRPQAGAWACAELLGRLIRVAPFDPQWSRALERADASRWSIPDPSGFSWAPRPRSAPVEPGPLARIVGRLPDVDGPIEHIDYLALIDRALVDSALSQHDTAALLETALALGIDSGTRHRLNLEYLERVVAVMAADDRTGPAQLGDLAAVAALLGVDAPTILSEPPRARRA